MPYTIRSQTFPLPRGSIAWAALVWIALLSGCASVVSTQVTTYARTPEVAPIRAEVKTFAFAPEAKSPKGIEREQQELALQSEMGPYGFVLAKPGTKPQVLVQFDAVSRETELRYLDHEPFGPYPGFYGRRGFYGGYYGRGFYEHPFYGMPIERVIKQWQHELNVRVVQGEGAQEKVVWEGRAVATTRNKQLSEHIPYLARALFKDYPGESGKTRTVDVPLR